MNSSQNHAISRRGVLTGVGAAVGLAGIGLAMPAGAEAATGHVRVYDRDIQQLAYGSRGTQVRKLQYLLRRWTPGLSADGSFGTATRNAVFAFQRARRLPVTGAMRTVADWTALFAVSGVRYGSRGDAVRGVQYALGFPIDGSFGPATLRRVKEFQRWAGFYYPPIAVDGIVGPRTWAWLFAIPLA